jgi:hypothetical protein
VLIVLDSIDIFEFVVELIMMYHSIPIGYGNVKTLTDAVSSTRVLTSESC